MHKFRIKNEAINENRILYDPDKIRFDEKKKILYTGYAEIKLEDLVKGLDKENKEGEQNNGKF